jgi:SAM-dependent methyltransferase
VKTSAEQESRYWDGIARVWRDSRPQVLWRAYSARADIELFGRWLPDGTIERLLKTDLFGEGLSGSMHEFLASRARMVTGLDLSASIVHAATVRNAGLHAICGDLRHLPFAEGAFDVIVSNSSLDHLQSRSEIAASLKELRRVLRSGGELLLTLDNLANPIIRLRSMIPFPLLNRLGIVPYYVGPTLGPSALRRYVEKAGLEVLEVTAFMHCPRVLAVAASRLLERYAGREKQQRFLNSLSRWERLAKWPSRFLTGHFVAIKAVKR